MGFLSTRRAVATAGVVIGVLSISPDLSAQVVVRGILYDDVTGLPVPGTVMLVDPSTDAAVVNAATDSVGGFTLKASGGTYQIVAIKPGYQSVTSAPVPLQNGEQITLRVPIAVDGDPVHKIGVTERVRSKVSAAPKESDRRMVDNGFEGRRVLGQGLHYDRARLEKSGVATLGQFLQTVPGMRVGDPSSTSSMYMSRNAGLNNLGVNGSPAACRVGWYMDGQRIDLPGRSDPMTDGLALITLDQIEAIEVFRGLSEMPAQFAAPDQRCGAVVLWMRRG